MTSAHLQQWMQHPETLDRDSLYELRTLVARYPYFQTARLLYLQNLYLLHDVHFGTELRNAVFYVADRRVLFYLIEGNRYALQPQHPASSSTTIPHDEPGVDRTMSLIDAFLATVPDECPSSMELDYAMDYTAYLLKDEEEVASVADTASSQNTPPMRGMDLIDGFIRKSEGVNEQILSKEQTVAAEVAGTEESTCADEKTVAIETDPVTEPCSTDETISHGTNTAVAASTAEVSCDDAKETVSVAESVNVDDWVEGDEEDSLLVVTDVDDSCFTETLAKIYVKQQRYDKALEIIKKLSLNYPKKNAYFADQIRFLEKLIINAKSK